MQTRGPKKIYSDSDEAAALSIGDPLESKIEGGLLFDFAEKLGTQFGQRKSDQKRSFLNKQIISRMVKAKLIFTSKNLCETHKEAVSDLRIVVKEITSFMTVILVQGLIHSIFQEIDPGGKENMSSSLLFHFSLILQHVATTMITESYILFWLIITSKNL